MRPSESGRFSWEQFAQRIAISTPVGLDCDGFCATDTVVAFVAPSIDKHSLPRVKKWPKRQSRYLQVTQTQAPVTEYRAEAVPVHEESPVSDTAVYGHSPDVPR